MPDATGLELVAQRVRFALGDDTVTGTAYHRELATLEVAPEAVHHVLLYLKEDDEEPYSLLTSVHGCDYLPDEPRFGVHYQLLSMERTERLNVKTRVGLDDPRVPSVVDVFPGANFQEREVYDMFGVVFDGHPDLRRILMPEDYEGHPQRRDFPMGGEPVLFTYNEDESPRWYE
ncbi:MAG TPA: NADH-quinone oxidoreductase subunit C [Thermoleophilaceae bacterium]|nr:NADH-quinone oxidoreductase subunit C [Thermoleophilaceae bacterium]